MRAVHGSAQMSAEAISRALERASGHVEKTTRKIIHRMYLDETRQSMYAELKYNFVINLKRARNNGIGDDCALLGKKGPDDHFSLSM